jgi:protein SCO1/2
MSMTVAKRSQQFQSRRFSDKPPSPESTGTGNTHEGLSSGLKNKGNTRAAPVNLLSLGLTAIVGTGLFLYFQMEVDKKEEAAATSQTGKAIGKPALGGPWMLVDQDGIPRTSTSFNGQYTLLYFGFTYCPDICPNELVKIGKIIDETKKRKDLQPVKPIFISVDPPRDTVGQLKHYAQDFHPDFTYLTGPSNLTAVATRAYRVYFSKVNTYRLRPPCIKCFILSMRCYKCLLSSRF